MKKMSKVYTALIMIFLFAPIAILLFFSFNEAKSLSVFSGFSLNWYRELMKDAETLGAVRNTLILALSASVVSTVMGTAAAVGINKLRNRALRTAMDTVTNIPMVNPDIITGISLMLMNMMLTLSSLVLSGYISMHGGVETVGIYQAGATIVVSYFAVIISAMSTEYYPRICGINDDDARLAQAVNAQSETGLIIGLPLIVSFVFLVPYFLRILYSDAFLSASQYTDFAIIGSIAIICSNCMGMVLLAKQNSRLFLISSFVCCFVILGLNILLYNILG